MAEIPYQPTYSVQPKYGTRYGASEFVAPQQSVVAPPAGLQGSIATPPPVMGTQQGSAAPAYTQDPLSSQPQAQAQVQNTSVSTPLTFSLPNQFSNQSQNIQGNLTGFRPSTTVPVVAEPEIPRFEDIYAEPVIDDPLPSTVSNASSRNSMFGQAGASDDYPDGNDPINNSALAQSYGYERGNTNIAAGLANMIPLVGGSLSESIRSDDPLDTYGKPGTYDAYGNVFGDEGRAYNPVTGAPVASYANRTAAYNTVTDSYNKSRAAGVNPIASALGSYDGSIYKQMELDPTLSEEGARQARMMGINSPIENLNKTITNNTINQKYDEKGLIGNGPIWGTQAGDYVQSDQGPLSVTSSGRLQDQSGGNVLALGGVSFINTDITDRASLTDAQRSVLDSRTSTTPQTDSMNPTIQDRDRTVGTGITSPTKSYQDILNDIIDPTKAISSDKTVGVGDMIKAGALTPVSVSTPSFADDSNNGGNDGGNDTSGETSTGGSFTNTGTDPDANDDSGMSSPSYSSTAATNNDKDGLSSKPSNNNNNDSGGGGGGGK